MLAGIKNDIDKNKDKKDVRMQCIKNVDFIILNTEITDHFIFFFSLSSFIYWLASSSSSPLRLQVCAIVIANMHVKNNRLASNANAIDPTESINRANNWCERERIKHYTVNAMERASLYEPFIGLAIRLHPPQTKTTFPQLRQLTQKTSKADNN